MSFLTSGHFSLSVSCHRPTLYLYMHGCLYLSAPSFSEVPVVDIVHVHVQAGIVHVHTHTHTHTHLPSSLLNYELASSVIVLLCIYLLWAHSCAKSPICE